MEKYTPETEGINHINMYSKSKTPLGVMLSNFYYYPIKTLDGDFSSVEGYWYWLGISDNEKRKEELRKAYGFKAKQLGRQILFETNDGKNSRFDENFESKISNAIWYKFKRNSNLLIPEYYNLPIVHYYVIGNRKVDMTDKYPWMMMNLTIMRDMIIEKQKRRI